MKYFEDILRLIDINNYLDVYRGYLGFREDIIAQRLCIYKVMINNACSDPYH